MNTPASTRRANAARHSLPPSASASSTGPQKNRPRDPDTCANCGAPLRATYCGVCGQRAANRIVPLWQVSNEFLEDLFDLDLRILRTLPTFFFRPGHLTTEYLHGRRRRFIRPLRLYLFSSFLLFTVLALTNLNTFPLPFFSATDVAQAEVAAVQSELEALRAELALPFVSGEEGVAEQEGTDRETDSNTSSAVDGRTETAYRDKLDRIDEALSDAVSGLPAQSGPRNGVLMVPSVEGADASEASLPALPPKVIRLLHDPSQFVDGMIDRAPYLMFLLVPTFALLLKLLYLRRKRLYLEHIIFALHVHAFAFLAFAGSAVLGAVSVGLVSSLDWWMALMPFGYLLLAVRHVYGQSWPVTVAKTLVLLLAYGVIMTGAIILLVMGTVFVM